MNLATHEVRLMGRQVKFTPTEEALFYILVRYAGKLVTCTHLTRCVWGIEGEDKMRDLHVYIGNLRKKLESHGGGVRIETEGSAGYRLQLVSDDEDMPHLEPARATAA
jgi:two-component system KDP operon response regulator KdpE